MQTLPEKTLFSSIRPEHLSLSGRLNAGLRNHLSRFPLLLLLATTSCGPIYDTTYSFEPPRSDSGRLCVYQCDTARMQCTELKQMKAENCNERSQRQAYYCAEDIRARYNREPKWYECSEELCSEDTEACEVQYHRCYQACGGRVNRETRCVANCPAPLPRGQ